MIHLGCFISHAEGRSTLQESGAEADALQGAVEVEEVAAAGGTGGRETHYPPGLGPVDGGWDDAPALQKGVFFTTAEFQQYAAGCKQPLPPAAAALLSTRGVPPDAVALAARCKRCQVWRHDRHGREGGSAGDWAGITLGRGRREVFRLPQTTGNRVANQVLPRLSLSTTPPVRTP